MNNNIVQSLERALNILEELSDAEINMGITELSKNLDLSKSTVHRLLNTLMFKGYVDQDLESKAYKLGIKLFELGSKVINSLEISKLAKPYLVKLMEETHEVVHLVIRDGNEGVYIDKVESDQPIKMYSQLGKRVPLYCSAAGKVLICNLSESQINDIYQNSKLVAYTENTITDLNTLITQLKNARKDGYAIDNEELAKDVRCIAAPILNFSGQVVAAISISGPIYRIDDDKLIIFSNKVKNIAMNISKKLGYRG